MVVEITVWWKLILMLWGYLSLILSMLNLELGEHKIYGLNKQEI